MAKAKATSKVEPKPSGRPLILGALLTSTFLALVITFDWLPSNGAVGGVIRAGDVAQVSVKAPSDVSLVDREATAAERQAAMDAAPAIYDFDDARAKSVLPRLRQAFAAASAPEAPAPEGSEPVHPSPAEAFVSALVPDSELDIKNVERLLQAADPLAVEEDLRKTLIPALTWKILDERSGYDRQAERRPIEVQPVGAGSAFRLSDPLTQAVTVAEAKEHMRELAEPVLAPRPKKLRDAMLAVAESLIRPNMSFNLRATEERKDAAARSVADVTITLRKGEIIVRDGDVLTARQVRVLQGLREQTEMRGQIEDFLGSLFVIFVALVVTWRFASSGIPRFARAPKDAFFLMVTLAFTALGIKLGLFICDAVSEHPAFSSLFQGTAQELYYVLPVAASTMLVRMVHTAETAAIFAVLTALLAGLQVDHNIGFAFYVLVGSLLAAVHAARVSQRGTLLRAGVRVGAGNVLVVMALLLLDGQLAAAPAVIALSAAFVGGCVSGGLVSALAPVVEGVFKYTTDVKLLELANREQPLLRELEVRAPGTYHHSMMVGHLAEKAAEVIGANALLAKVAGYYHDIGKMRRPHFFVENITIHQGENRHEKLAPSMSSRIIQAHVKDGLELGARHQLAPAIMRGIGEHHGTSVIRYFYEKAKEQANPDKGDTVREHDYRYAGPKPQTREAGILMLADSVEAASRTLADASTPRIQQLVQRIINNYFRDGQLDECSLTLRDLHAIARSFIETLSAIRHERIDYPEATDAEGRRAEETTDESVVERLDPRARDRSERAAAKRQEDLRRLGLP